MRLALAILLSIPAFAQQTAPPTQPPAAPPAQAPAAAAQAPEQQAAAPADTAKAADNPAPASEPWITGSMYLGYRARTDVAGSFQEYRSLVDLGEGPKLFDLNFTIQDPKKRLFDRIDAWAQDWGDDPYTTAHVNARKLGIYDFSFDYRNLAYFSAVPSFANPVVGGNFDWQSFDIRKKLMNIDLRLFSGKHISPYIVYERNANSGNGIEPWTNDANNTYPVPTLLRDSTNNYRAGVSFEFTRFQVTLEQGGTTYQNNDQAYDNTYQPGDRSTPALGQTLSLSSLRQWYGIRGHGIYEKVLLTARPTSWIDVYGQFLYSQPKTDVNFSEIATGNLLNLASLLFYSGQVTLGTGAANQPHTTGNFGFELRPVHRLRILESVMTDRYHDAASPLIAEQILLNPTTAGPNTITALNYTQFVNYNQQEVNAIFDVAKGLTLRGGYRFVWGDAQVLAGDLSQRGTVIPGSLRRNVGLAGLTWRPMERFSLNAEYEGSSSDNIYFRTSLNNYNKGRVRARFQATKSLLLQANFLVLNNQNPAPDIRFDYQNRSNALTLYWTPANNKWVTAMAEYDRSTLRSDIAYLVLPFLSPATSSYRDNGHTGIAAVDLAPPRLKGAKLTLGGSFFVSAGFTGAESRPTRYYQPLASIAVPVVKNVYWNAEWRYYGYGEPFYVYEGFRTHIFTTGVRITR
jgi:hypothetical protein